MMTVAYFFNNFDVLHAKWVRIGIAVFLILILVFLFFLFIKQSKLLIQVFMIDFTEESIFEIIG